MVIGAIIGGVTSILGGLSASSQQRRQEQQQRAAAEEKYDWDVDVYNWQNDVANQQYQWQLAQNQVLRGIEAQAAEDYRVMQQKTIEAALANLKINRQALFDQYVRAENIRAKQEVMTYEKQQADIKQQLDQAFFDQGIAQKRLLLEAQGATDRERFQQQELGIQANELSREASFESYMTGLDLIEQTRQYLNQGQQIQARLDIDARGIERKAYEVLSSMALEEKADYMGWQLETIKSQADGGVLANRSVAQQGGGTTAKRMSIQSAQALGRTWGQLALAARSRDLRRSVLNEEMTKGLGAQFGLANLQMQDLNEKALYALASSKARQGNIQGKAQSGLDAIDVRSKSSRARFRLDMRGAELGLDSSLGQLNFALDAGRRNFDFNKKRFTRVVLPGFELARRQGIRELQALKLNTQNTIDRASMPYRGNVIFDPMAPIPGPAPRLGDFNSYSSTGAAVGNALIQGAGSAAASWLNNLGQGSLQFGSGGNDAWRTGFSLNTQLAPSLGNVPDFSSSLGNVTNNVGTAFSGGLSF